MNCNKTMNTDETPAEKCECVTCTAADKDYNPFNRKMIVCPVCGNKRCPKASYHNHDCTGSNEPGQHGSIYGDYAIPNPDPDPDPDPQPAAEPPWRALVEGEQAQQGDKIGVLLGGMRDPNQYDFPHTEGVHKSYWRTRRPLPSAPPATEMPVGKISDDQMQRATPQCWTAKHTREDGEFDGDKYAEGYNACVEGTVPPDPAPAQTACESDGIWYKCELPKGHDGKCKCGKIEWTKPVAALGWAYAYACNLADKGIDIRKIQVPQMLADFQRDFKITQP
jgi:hypothetical protein